MTFQEQQKRINRCYAGYKNDGVFVSRGFARLKYYDKAFLKMQSRKGRIIRKVNLPF